MSRSIARIVVMVAACLIVVALGGAAFAAARGNAFAARRDGGPGPILSQTVPNPASAATAATNTSASQDNDGDNDNSAASSGAEGSDAGDQNLDHEQEQELAGTVASIDTANSAFTVTTASGTVTCVVTGETEFGDGVSALSSLQQGMSVKVDGVRQASGSLLAVDVKGASDSNAPENGDASGSGGNQ